MQTVRDLLYGFYARRLEAALDHDQIPRHVGVILDGNRRWAKASGAPKSRGWRAVSYTHLTLPTNSRV